MCWIIVTVLFFIPTGIKELFGKDAAGLYILSIYLVFIISYTLIDYMAAKNDTHEWHDE